MKRAGKIIKYFLLGILGIIATIICFYFESEYDMKRYRLTVGCAFITIAFFVSGCLSFSKKNDRKGVMEIEDIFKMKTGGVVVVGFVHGCFLVKDHVEVHQNSHIIKSKIHAMEIQGKKAQGAKDCYAALYLKDIDPSEIHIHDTVSFEG